MRNDPIYLSTSLFIGRLSDDELVQLMSYMERGKDYKELPFFEKIKGLQLQHDVKQVIWDLMQER